MELGQKFTFIWGCCAHQPEHMHSRKIVLQSGNKRRNISSWPFVEVVVKGGCASKSSGGYGG